MGIPDEERKKGDEANCIQIQPTKCEDCVRLGPECVKANGEEKVCEKLGYDSKKNSCKEDNMCIQMVPSKCEDCIKLGPKCVKSNGQEKTCEKFQYNINKNSCKT